jgi:hypothetical protein
VPEGFATEKQQTVSVEDKACAEVDWSVRYDGHVKGRVVDVDGKPVAGIGLQLNARGGAAPGVPAYLDFASTDSNGNYDFAQVPPGDYLVVANRWGASPRVPYPEEYFRQPGESHPGTVHLDASGTVEHIDLTLPRARTPVALRVSVVLQDGSAAASVSVWARDESEWAQMELFHADTDKDGHALLTVYEGRTYYVSALLRGGAQQRCGGPVRITAKDGMALAAIKIEYDGGGCLARRGPASGR